MDELPKTEKSWIRRHTEQPEHLRLGRHGDRWYVSHDRYFGTREEARAYAQGMMADWPLSPGEMLTPEMQELARRVD